MKIKSLKVNEGWLKERFGDHVAQISTDTTIKLKMAIKDTFRALHGAVPDSIEELCKELPNPPQGISDQGFVFGYEDDAGNGHVPGLTETNQSLKRFIDKFPKEWEIISMLLSHPRQKSKHPCGFTFLDEPVQNLIPLMTVGDGRVTQFTAPFVESSGGLKMDFLVVNSLNDISNALKLIQNRHKLPGDLPSCIDNKKVPSFRLVPFKGRYYDVWDLPEDIAVFNDICEGKTESVFQFHTPGAKQWLSHFNFVKDKTKDGTPIKGLSSVVDLATFTALDRPGPLDAMVKAEDGTQHNMLIEFARRAAGKPRIGNIEYFDETLKGTYGIIVFQEQLQKVFQELSGCTGIQANDFRQRIGKKKVQEVGQKDYPIFIKGATEKLGEKQAQEVWQQLYTFGQYGFNLSHAVCYSMTGYVCAFLKHYYPLEWWCAVLKNAKRDEIDEKFWRYCGHLIDMPDIRRSSKNFEIIDNKIQAPLSLIKGLGEKAHDQLESMRPFESIQELLQKIEQWKINNPRIMERTNKQTGEKEKKLVKGLCAINDTMIQKMIVGGVMDGLFPEKDEFGEPMLVQDKLFVYEKSKGKTKTKKIAASYNLQSELAQFQLKKEILPVYSQSLVKLIQTIGNKDIIKRGSDNLFVYENEEWPIVSGEDYEVLSTIEYLPGNTFLAVPAYVIEDRRFSYTQRSTGDTKVASELNLDLDGQRFNMVKWPHKEKGLPKGFERGLTGTVSMFLFSRLDGKKDFYLIDVVVLAEPLEKKEDDDNETERSSN